jgi:hypothetical protein
VLIISGVGEVALAVALTVWGQSKWDETFTPQTDHRYRLATEPAANWVSSRLLPNPPKGDVRMPVGAHGTESYLKRSLE